MQKIINELETHFRHQDQIASWADRKPHPYGTGPTRIAVASLWLWALHSAHFDTEIDRTNPNNCNLFVATSIAQAGYDYLEQPIATAGLGKIGFTRFASANTWYNAPEDNGRWRVFADIEVEQNARGGAKTVVKLSTREPQMGDIVAFDNHVGILLGHGLYLSSTARNDWPNQNPHGVQIKPIPQISRRYLEVINHQGR